MSNVINFTAAQSAFAAAVAGLEQVTAVSPEKTARLDKILARIEADAKLAVRVLSFGAAKGKGAGLEAAVVEGAVVTFNFGRGEEKRRTLTGTVIATRPAGEKQAPAARVRVGSGFDEEVLTIHPAWVIAVEGVAQAEEESEADQLDLIEGVDVAGVYGADDIIG